MWGIIPAAGEGSRIQPLAFSKELLPVGSKMTRGIEQPRAVSDYIIERMVRAGATKICIVIAPGKSDILEYYGSGTKSVHFCYMVQEEPRGLCDAIFRALPLIDSEEHAIIGLPDTVWFPEDAFCKLPDYVLSFLLFPVDRPEFFDSVILKENNEIREILVKVPNPGTSWVWGAFKMPGTVLYELHEIWLRSMDEYVGTLVNTYIQNGGRAVGMRLGELYFDVGTLSGYRTAIKFLHERQVPLENSPDERQPLSQITS